MKLPSKRPVHSQCTSIVISGAISGAMISADMGTIIKQAKIRMAYTKEELVVLIEQQNYINSEHVYHTVTIYTRLHVKTIAEMSHLHNEN